MDSNKKIVIIGSIIIGCIVLFTAVFVYFGLKDIADLEKQLSNLENEQRQLMLDTAEYDKSVQTEDVAGHIKTMKEKGNRIADIENQMMRFDFEHTNPLDAPSEENRIDKKVRKELAGYFHDIKSYYCEEPWFMGENTVCKFEPVFQYKTKGTIVTWTVSMNNRVVGFVTAEYDPDRGTFTDLKLYETVYGETVGTEAFDKMVERVRGPLDNDTNAEEETDTNQDNDLIAITPEESEADPGLDTDHDGFLDNDDPIEGDEKEGE